MSKRLESLRSQLADIEARRATAQARSLELAEKEEDSDEIEAEALRSAVKEFHDLTPEADKLRGEIAQLEAVLNAPERALEVGSPTFIVRGKQSGSMDLGNEFKAPDEVRSLALAAAERDMVEVTDSQREDISRALRRHDSADGRLARHVLAHSRPEYRSAFQKSMTAAVRGVPVRLTDDEAQAMEFARSVTITSGSAGTSIPVPLDPSIIITGTQAGMGNVWRSICRNVQTMSNTWNGVSSAGITVGYGAEAAEATDNSPSLTAIAMTLHRGRGLVPFSIESEQDWSGLQSEIMSMFQTAKDNNDDATFSAIAAAAADTPSGFPYLLTTNWSGQIVTSITGDTFAVGDVHKLRDTLPMRFQNSTSWLANALIYGKIRQFDTAGGAGLWAYIGDGRPNQLMGRPVYEGPGIDGTFGSGENYVLFYGDFSQAFIIGDRLGTTVELIPHLLGNTNNFPTGERGLFMNWRTGTQIGNQSAVVTLNVT